MYRKNIEEDNQDVYILNKIRYMSHFRYKSIHASIKN